MDIHGFVRALVSCYQEGYCADIDGGDVHELLLEHGFLEERVASADDIERHPDLQDDGVEVGDVVCLWSQEFQEFMKKMDLLGRIESDGSESRSIARGRTRAR